jgi:purine-binding chemotaxis protein CheW
METASAVDSYLAQTDTENLCLTFRLGDQDYGIAISKVQEIREWTKVTPLPNSPPYIRGMLNLRGAIVPVIDLRLRFGLDALERDSATVIIVVNVGNRLAGILVDTVSDVISVDREHRRALPEFEGHANRQFIEGLAQIEDRLMVLLNIDQLVAPEDLVTMTPVAGETEQRRAV